MSDSKNKADTNFHCDEALHNTAADVMALDFETTVRRNKLRNQEVFNFAPRIVLAQDDGFITQVGPIETSRATSGWSSGKTMNTRSLQSGFALLFGSGTLPVTIRTSSTPLRSAFARRVRRRSTVASSIRGNLCRKSSKDALRLPAVSDVQKPIAS